MKNFISVPKFYFSQLLKISPYEFNKIFSETESEFKNHPAYNHEIFSTIKEITEKEGINGRQFLIQRDNFLKRTSDTILSVNKTLEAATKEGDSKTVSETALNLYQEGGSGDPKRVHYELMLNSYNKFGGKIFGVPDVKRFKDLDKSSVILEETHQFHKTLKRIYKLSYPGIIGALFAREMVADDMLEGFREAIFEPYKNYFNKDEYGEIMEYFKEHRDEDRDGGKVEQLHGEMAKNSAYRASSMNKEKLKEMRGGGILFLDVQAKLWDGMLKAIVEAEKYGVKIPPKQVIKELSDNDKIPSNSMVPSKAQSLKKEEKELVKLN